MRMRSEQLGDAPSRLVLWDVDHTLVDLSGSSHGWYGEALTLAFGSRLRSLPDTAGRTELAITTDLLSSHGIDPTADAVRTMFDALEQVVADHAEQLAAMGRALPGAHDALRTLATDAGIAQTLVTGNLPAVARLKLAAFGLDGYVDFALAGFGSLAVVRDELVPAAVSKAQTRFRREYAPRDVVVIGDTPLDMAAARSHGAVAIGVATGKSDRETLREAGADFCFSDLSDTSALLAAVAESSR
jgi:phosphoglycolate phosphatase-like HAD superfamily hydrolase